MGKTFDVTNPVNDKVIGSVSDSTAEDAESVIQIASQSFKKWASTTPKERGALLQKLGQLCITHADDLAKIITAESGKPLTEAKGEVLYSAGRVFSNIQLIKCSLLLFYRVFGILCRRIETDFWRSASMS